jgi:hypothetical protein
LSWNRKKLRKLLQFISTDVVVDGFVFQYHRQIREAPTLECNGVIVNVFTGFDVGLLADILSVQLRD